MLINLFIRLDFYWILICLVSDKYPNIVWQRPRDIRASNTFYRSLSLSVTDISTTLPGKKSSNFLCMSFFYVKSSIECWLCNQLNKCQECWFSTQEHNYRMKHTLRLMALKHKLGIGRFSCLHSSTKKLLKYDLKNFRIWITLGKLTTPIPKMNLSLDSLMR